MIHLLNIILLCYDLLTNPAYTRCTAERQAEIWDFIVNFAIVFRRGRKSSPLFSPLPVPAVRNQGWDYVWGKDSRKPKSQTQNRKTERE